MNGMKKTNTLYWIYSFCVGIALILLVVQNYFSLDEPNILWELRSGTGWSRFYNLFIADGRPIYGAIQMGAIEVAGTLANLKFLRIISVLFTFLFSLLIFNYLKKKGVTAPVAFIICSMIFSIPGFSVFICWAQQYSHHFSSIFSFYAGMLVTAVFAFRLGEDKLGRSTENKYIFFAVLLQLFSLLIYQSMALSFVIPAFFTLVLKRDVAVKNRLYFLASVLFLFFICLIVYYKLFQSILHSSGIAMTTRGTSEGIDPLFKLKWLMSILKEASKLHLLLLKNSLPSFVFSLVMVFILIRDLILKRFMDVLFLFLFAALLILPHLVIAVSWGASRNFALITLIFIFYSVTRIFELLPSPPVAIAIAVSSVFIGLMFMNILEGWVKPMKKDYNYLHEFAGKLPPIQRDTLFVGYIPPAWNLHEKKSFLKYYYDEFNAPEFFRIWPIVPGLKCLYQDTHPGTNMETINKYLRIDSVNAPSLKNKQFIELNFNYQ